MDYPYQMKRIMAELPEYCTVFFQDKSKSLSEESLYMYGVDLNIFFRYLKDEIFVDRDITPMDLKDITPKDIERYMSYLTQYNYNGRVYRNSSGSKQRKLIVIRSFFSCMMAHGYIDVNPAIAAPIPKKNKKNVRMIGNEDIEKIFLFIKDPNSFKENKKKNEIHQKNRKRNYLILLLQLYYHLSPREIASLNVTNIKKNCIQYHQKGQLREITLSPSHMLELMDYVTGIQDARSSYGEPNKAEDKDALFYSRKRNRISIRNIEVLSAEYKKSGIIKEHKV